VWGVRVMGTGLAVVAAGIVTLAFGSTATAKAILAVGIGVYLVGVVITVVGIILVYRNVPPPRPNFFNLRWSLLRDVVHARSANTEPWAEVPGPLGERPRMEDLRHSGHWRLAVRGVRVMGTGLAVVIVGIITLAWSTAATKAILGVGVGIYLIGLGFTLVEARRAYGEAQPPRPNHAWVQRTLLHDALHRSGPSSQDSTVA
jgi:uncharacterized membrane protein HdeD (DUF308 family)